MLLPYYIAALNIEHAYYEQTGEYEAFEGLCFVDTLDLAEARQAALSFMTEKNTERVERQKRTPITVIIGNPPYNVGQANENDNNKNREVSRSSISRIKRDIREGFNGDAHEASCTTRTSNSSAGRPIALEGRDGIVCFVTNNSFVEQIAFDGMRKHLLQDFAAILSRRPCTAMCVKTRN